MVILEWLGYGLIFIGIFFGIIGQKWVKVRLFIFKDHSMFKQYALGLILTLTGIACLYLAGIIY